MRRLINGLRVLFSPRTWLHIVAVVAFLGQDTVEQGKIRKGRGVKMSPTVSVRNGRNIVIGAGASIGQGCHLWAGEDHGIEIGAGALFGPNVFVTASNYRFDDNDGPVEATRLREADVYIGANTWIGTGVVVVAGAHIGNGAIIGAGAVVSGKIPDLAVAVGIPARVVRSRL